MNLSGLLDILRKQEAYRALLEELAVEASGDSLRGSLGLIRAARPYLIAALASDIARPLLVITARSDYASNLAEQLLAWCPNLRVLSFAEPNALFYERVPWGRRVTWARLQVLTELTIEPRPGTVIVASARGLMQRTLPPEVLKAHSTVLARGQRTPGGQPDQLLRHWLEIGYEPVTLVTEPGTFSRRGGIIDVFPVADSQPTRLELWGDEIESLRAFDPTTQRSLEARATVTVTPAREALPLFGPQVVRQLEAQGIRKRSVAPVQHLPLGMEEEQQDNIASDLSLLEQGTAFPTLEFYLPWMVRETSLLEYLPPQTPILVDDWDDLSDTVADLEAQALSLREAHLEAGDIPAEMPLPFTTWDHLQEELLHAGALELDGTPGQGKPLGNLFAAGPRYAGQLKIFLEELHRLSLSRRDRAIVVSRQAERLAGLWHELGRGPRLTPTEEILEPPPPTAPTFVQGGLAEGWLLRDGQITTHLLTDAEIFGWQRPEPRRRPRRRPIAPEDFFADLAPDDYVVHAEYGVGRFKGLEKRTLNGVEREFLVISYAGGDLLYVPIHQADRLSRYIGADDSEPELSRLGTADWSRTRERAQQAVEEIARELLELYAARELVTGHAFSPDTPWQHELEASFPYVETEDQLRALAEVKADMEKPRPMDRLICGDVGYGKTEVALRAAFKAVMDGKQVAILVPTTVLAQQHYETFTRRLAAFPVVVEMLSRFRSYAEQQIIIEKLAEGKIDIIIGTHRLLGRDVVFRDLGLLIIDEEQRFGVTHKEQLKRIRTEVDVLTLTATPIPRTLYMSLTGVRDISVIETAPEERLSVTTWVGRRDDDLIRQAILRELDRGGQVFYVHNRVQTIYAEAERLRRLVPEATIVVGHGQMAEAELEDVMTRFAAGEIDVLVSTSIIEAGLDIPNANTLIVDRADQFGLAQLYQLRGRVGRSANRAFAYFFHPPLHSLTPEARARLETIAEKTELGAGMDIAMRDLEIRGAGDILGARQHGHIAAVGFHLYTRMLAQAVRRLREEREGRATAHGDGKRQPEAGVMREVVTIDLPLPTYIPTSYIPDSRLRIQLYRRMADLTSEQAVADLRAELSDRFGPLPEPVENLLYQLRVKLLAQRADVEAVVGEGDQIAIRLAGLAHVDRPLLQQRLGHGVRVSRTAIWMAVADGWQTDLIEVLEALADR
jgi:transcription-repair coupling factor (superfamily II helicase)